MPRKTSAKPSLKVKHKPFASFCTRLQDNDWMIGVFNPNDKTAAYFLAEPIPPNSSEAQQLKTKKASGPASYIVSALARQGLAETSIKGLPKKFKAVDDAMEWLESKIEEYEGDKVPDFETVCETVFSKLEEGAREYGNAIGRKIKEKLVNETIADFKTSGGDIVNNSDLPAYSPKTGKFINTIEYFAKEIVKDPSKPGSVTSLETKEYLSHKDKKIKVSQRSKNGEKSKKTAKSDEPYVKPASKFKTSKEELKSLGLGGLFDEE